MVVPVDYMCSRQASTFCMQLFSGSATVRVRLHFVSHLLALDHKRSIATVRPKMMASRLKYEPIRALARTMEYTYTVSG